MKNTQNTTVILLLCSAVILTGLLIGSYTMTSQNARAESSQRLNSYITTTGAYSSSTDLVYILNIDTGVLNVYALDTNKGVIELRDAVDLRKYFKL
jgi:hypothetical protein